MNHSQGARFFVRSERPQRCRDIYMVDSMRSSSHSTQLSSTITNKCLLFDLMIRLFEVAGGRTIKHDVIWEASLTSSRPCTYLCPLSASSGHSEHSICFVS